jgi:hypothetical protein
MNSFELMKYSVSKHASNNHKDFPFGLVVSKLAYNADN